MTIWQAFFQYANRIPQPLWQKGALLKVFDLNLMTGFGQDSDSRLRQGVTQAIGDWMGDNDKTPHVGSDLLGKVLMLPNGIGRPPAACGSA